MCAPGQARTVNFRLTASGLPPAALYASYLASSRTGPPPLTVSLQGVAVDRSFPVPVNNFTYLQVRGRQGNGMNLAMPHVAYPSPTGESVQSDVVTWTTTFDSASWPPPGLIEQYLAATPSATLQYLVVVTVGGQPHTLPVTAPHVNLVLLQSRPILTGIDAACGPSCALPSDLVMLSGFNFAASSTDFLVDGFTVAIDGALLSPSACVLVRPTLTDERDSALSVRLQPQVVGCRSPQRTGVDVPFTISTRAGSLANPTAAVISFITDVTLQPAFGILATRSISSPTLLQLTWVLAMPKHRSKPSTFTVCVAAADRMTTTSVADLQAASECRNVLLAETSRAFNASTNTVTYGFRWLDAPTSTVYVTVAASHSFARVEADHAAALTRPFPRACDTGQLITTQRAVAQWACEACPTGAVCNGLPAGLIQPRVSRQRSCEATVTGHLAATPPLLPDPVAGWFLGGGCECVRHGVASVCGV